MPPSWRDDGAQELASRLRHTEAPLQQQKREQQKTQKARTQKKARGRSGRSSRGSRGSAPFYTEEGVAARLKLLENENVKQVLTTSSKRYVARSDVAHYTAT